MKSLFIRTSLIRHHLLLYSKLFKTNTPTCKKKTYTLQCTLTWRWGRWLHLQTRGAGSCLLFLVLSVKWHANPGTPPYKWHQSAENKTTHKNQYEFEGSPVLPATNAKGKKSLSSYEYFVSTDTVKGKSLRYLIFSLPKLGLTTIALIQCNAVRYMTTLLILSMKLIIHLLAMYISKCKTCSNYMYKETYAHHILSNHYYHKYELRR